MNVIDIGEGGVLVALKKGVTLGEDSLFNVGLHLKGLELIFGDEKETVLVQIKEAVIRRRGKDLVTGRDTCALQFMDIEKHSRKTLVELIYQFQRDILRSRLSNET